MIRHDHQDPCFGGAFRVFLGLPSYVLLLVIGKDEHDIGGTAMIAVFYSLFRRF